MINRVDTQPCVYLDRIAGLIGREAQLETWTSTKGKPLPCAFDN